jgi:anaerobic magnesium-protoporphyrin IX monomethyl ester cyclase
MTRVLCVQPDSDSTHSLMQAYETAIPPIGLLYIGAVLQRECSVKILDENAAPLRLEDDLNEFAPHYVLISAYYSFQFPRAVRIAELVKAVAPDTRVVLGGVHVTFADAEALLARFERIDYLVQGDGEFSLLKLIQGVDPEEIEGLAFRRDGEIISNGVAWVSDLDSVPFPARDLVDLRAYKNNPFEYTDHRNTFLVTSRGCSFRCTNCASSPHRVRSPGNVIEEIVHLLDRGISDYTLFDACFTSEMGRAGRICEEMVDLGRPITWACETRLDRVPDPLLRKMARAGCRSIMFGIEAGSQRGIDQLRKGIDLSQAKQTIDRVKAHGIKAYGMFILGLPGETPREIEETIAFSKTLGLNQAWYSIATPLPGTGLWPQADLDEHDLELLEKISFYSGDVAFHDKEQMEQYLFEAVRSFYFRPGVIAPMLRDMLTHGTLERRLHLFELLVLRNPYLRWLLPSGRG